MKRLMNSRFFFMSMVVTAALSVTSCYQKTEKASEETTTQSTGIEYAPQMYHSIPYEPLTQVTDEDAGDFFGEINGHGEFYNTNYYNEAYVNANGDTVYMNGRHPAKGTVKRVDEPMIKYYYNDIPADSFAMSERMLENPVPIEWQTDSAGNIVYEPTPESEELFAECEELYTRFCYHCHGSKGYGDGPVGKKYGGVTSYVSAGVANKEPGHIYHVITHGKGRMAQHASQISPEDRWKIVTYVQKLQHQE